MSEMEKPQVEQDTERIARRLAKEAGQEALWELYLPEAYEEWMLAALHQSEEGQET